MSEAVSQSPVMPKLIWPAYEKIAIAGSLGIVGTISLFGGIPYARRGLVDGRSLIDITSCHIHCQMAECVGTGCHPHLGGPPIFSWCADTL